MSTIGPRLQWVLFSSLSALALVGCGGSSSGTGSTTPTPPENHTIGGIVNGLNGTLELQNSGGITLSVTANGAFSFGTPAAGGAAYNVTVSSQNVIYSHSGVYSTGSSWIDWIIPVGAQIDSENAAYGVSVPQ